MLSLQILTRRVPALGFAAALLTSTLIAPSPVRADLPPQPAARLQVVLKTLHVYDDRDWGDGEMKFFAGLYEVEGQLSQSSPPVATTRRAFSAGSGDDVALERIVPSDGDTLGGGASPAGEMPVFAGRQYVFSASMFESDSISAEDDMGEIQLPVDAGNGRAIGTHTVRSTRLRGGRGDFSLTFEIRAMPLPDLQPTAFRVNSEGADERGDREDQVCFTVQNGGPVASEPFRATIAIEGATPPVRDVGAFGLAAGETREQCTSLFLPDSGDHQLTLTVDRDALIPERDEANNVYQQVLVRAPVPVGTPGPAAGQPATSQAAVRTQADLTVSAIRVNGRVADGKDDCKDGKNDVAVVVKNAGSANAGGFAVRLVVNGGEAGEESVKGLDAGQEREVRFEDVRLKKGEQKLTATVAPKGTVAESNANNNELKLSAVCAA